MRNRILQQISSDFKSLIQGLIASAILFIMIGVWRIFDTTTFLFLQIFFSCIFLYIAFVLTFPKTRFIKKSSQGFLSILIAFTIVSSLTLNIDRSRSVYLVKWVYEYSKEKPVSIEDFLVKKSFSPGDEIGLRQRIAEQKQTLFIQSDDSSLELTLLGKGFIKFAAILSNLLHLDGFKSA